MSARKIKKHWTVDFYFEGERQRHYSIDNSRAGARAYERSMRQRLARGEPAIPLPPPRPVTFGEYVTKFFNDYAKTNNKPSEQESKSLILRKHLLPHFGELPLDRIRLDTIERYKKLKLDEKLARKTINNHLIVLGTALRLAMESEVLATKPRIQLLKARSHRDDFLSQEETALLLNYDEEPQWRLMLLVALRLGLRRGELMGLDWRDLDFERGILTVRHSIVRGILGTTKGDEERWLELTPNLLTALAPRRRATGFVFQSPGGGPISKSMMTQAMRRICRRVGIRHVGWHILRHTAISNLAHLPLPPTVVQAIAGHKSYETTEKYIHQRPGMRRDGLYLLERYQNGELDTFGQQMGNASNERSSTPSLPIQATP